MPRLSGSIRVQSGRCKDIPRKAKMGFHLRGAGALGTTQQILIKTLSPCSCHGNRQSSGQTTKSLLIRRKVREFPYRSRHRFILLSTVLAAFVFAKETMEKALQFNAAGLFVIHPVILWPGLPGRLRFCLPAARQAHPAQAPAPRRPEYRWENEHRDTAG